MYTMFIWQMAVCQPPVAMLDVSIN